MSLDAKEKLSEHAYYIWEAHGRPEGQALDHWLQAEAELRARPRPKAEEKAAKVAKKKAKAAKKKTGKKTSGPSAPTKKKKGS